MNCSGSLKTSVTFQTYLLTKPIKIILFSPGQIVMSTGAFYANFPLMQFSRFVFGMGGESLSVAQNTYASAWFRGDALNMVFGLQVTYIDKVPYFTKRPY